MSRRGKESDFVLILLFISEDVYTKSESIDGHDLLVHLMDTYHPHMVRIH
jgi:hypothetical protein